MRNTGCPGRVDSGVEHESSHPLRILAISGSLRAASTNTALVRAIAALAPPGMELSVYDGLGDLPHYSPDLDGDTPPTPVADLRVRLRASDGVLICTPEYAHGMPGSLKNALDWLVSSGEFDGGKPTAALSASPSHQGGDKAHAWLIQTLRVMGAHIPTAASLSIGFIRAKLGPDGSLSDPDTVQALRAALDSLAREIEARKQGPSPLG